LYDPRLDELLVALRESKGIRSLERDRSGREALRVLRRGECLGVLIDQDTSVGGDFVPFFGQPAHTPTGPLALAAKTGASVLPMAIHREPDSTYVITVNPPLDLTRTADRKEDLRTNTARVTAILEHFIRTHPTQWVWFHDRWRTKPPAKDEPDQGARGAGTPDEQTNT
jgi:KDO2-lipid IV(A) lauroyltransferase